MNSRDGSQRYVEELLRGLHALVQEPANPWQIDVHLGMRQIVTLQHVVENVLARPDQDIGNPSREQNKPATGFLQNLSSRVFDTLLDLLPDGVVSGLQQWNRALQSFVWSRFKKIDFTQYDLVHLTLPQFYHTLADCNTRLLSSVFDLSHVHYPQFHMRNNIVCTEKGLQFAVANNASFVAISEATRKDFLAHFPDFDGSRIHTIHCGRDAGAFRPITDTHALQQVRDRYQLPDRPFFLSLSTLEPRKNLINSIRAFLHFVQSNPELDVCLVIAGRTGWKFDDIFDAAQQHRERIVFTGFIADEDLPAIYSSALALSYVSYYEGFGLPPLEAMSCGTPVIYGDNSSMPEVIDGAGLPAEPDDIEDIARQFKAMAGDTALRDTLSGAALAQANKFSWETMAQQTLAIYRQVAG
ncbi:MAG: glycosyltransferase family 4 protein [Halioglobus sp.]|nr:glycosyltransferase family 4 protein [Halioglobus sp.]